MLSRKGELRFSFRELCYYNILHLALFPRFPFTVNSAYNEPAYKKLLVIRNCCSFPNLYQGTSLFYVYQEHRL